MGNKFIIPVYQISTFLILFALIVEFPCVNAEENVTYYYANKCDTHPSCNEVCGNFKGLHPRCDRNGVCVCDCTNMEIINSNPAPEVCKTHISSVDHDDCIKYSQNTYGREQARICGKPGSYLYCTALCKWY